MVALVRYRTVPSSPRISHSHISQLPDAMVQFDNHLGNTLYSPLPAPVVPATQTPPQQEPGQRPHTS